MGKQLKKYQTDYCFSMKTAFYYFIKNTWDQISLNPSQFFKEGLNVKFCDLYFLVAT